MSKHINPWIVGTFLAACGGSDPDAQTSTVTPGTDEETRGSSTAIETSATSDASSGSPEASGGSTSPPSTGEGATSSSETGSSETGAAASCGWTDGPIGWAAEDGGTDGGAGGPTVMVDSAAALIEAAGLDEPRIIVVQGEITLANPLRVASNKTILGQDGGATILGELDINGSDDAFIENVIVRNLVIDGRNGSNDTIHVEYARHLWFDHLDLRNGADGTIDLAHGVDFVTVSWSRVSYDDAPDPQHRFASLVGHSDDNGAEDMGRLRITYHHDWWTDGVVERMPRVRFGRVHVFNNLYDSPDTNYCIRAGVQARIVIEANDFDGVDTPHEIDGAGAEVVAFDNVYDGTSGAQDTGGQAFTPPYAYTPDPAAVLRELLPGCVGPI